MVLGSKSPKLKHVVCHRRKVYMTLNDTDSPLNLSLNFNIDGFKYIVTSETITFFGCKS